MLHSYAFSNFQSFRERVEVDLTLNKKTRQTDWMAETQTGQLVSKLMAVIGPNGSGKTALLKPLAFLGWFISRSFQIRVNEEIPFDPHFSSRETPSEFECILDFDGKIWRYNLVCTPQRVIHEALYQRHDRFRYVFVRDWDDATKTYNVRQQDFGFSPKEAKKARPNVSLISTAAQYGVPLAMRMIDTYVITNVNLFGRQTLNETALFAAARHFANKPEQREKMDRLLAEWDLGLSGVEIKEVERPSQQNPEKTETVWLPYGKHKTQNTEISLPFIMESSGTQGAFVLLSRLLQTLEIGGLAVIDEFENDLHPHMLEPILDLFSNPKFNPYNAQLIFSCHAMEVLNLLSKSQVTLVQKDEECESAACRMDAVEGIRNDDNLYAKYMAGAYGAVPNL